MKKLSYILMVLVVMFICNSNVSAKDKEYNVKSCKESDDCVILCSYDNSIDKEIRKSYIFYTNSNTTFYEYGYLDIEGTKSKIFYKLKKSNDAMDEKNYKYLTENGLCPTYGYLSHTNGIIDGLFYSNTQKSKEYGTGKKTQDKIRDVGGIGDYITENYYNCENYLKIDPEDAESYITELDKKVYTNIKNKYFSKTWEIMPDFFKNYYKEKTKTSIKDHCVRDATGELNGGEITMDEYLKKIEKYNAIDEEFDYSGYLSDKINKITAETDKIKEGAVDCGELIGKDISDLINEIYMYVYIGVPILIIILGMFDFSKGVLANKDEDLKKAKHNFIKRVIMGVAVFLIPTFINIIFGIVNEANYSGGANNYFKYIKGSSCVEDVLSDR